MLLKIMLLLNQIIGILLLILLSPLFLLISLIIVIDNGLPVIFKQKRIGFDNSEFLLYKFRTMKNNTPDLASHLLKNTKTYYTSTGPFLRKFSIDELPQIFNIIKGNMKFIGPRPALFNQEDLIQLRRDKGIDQLTPGITGWAQINGRDDLDIKEKVDLDFFYLKNKSVLLNLKILWLTILKVVKAESVSL